MWIKAHTGLTHNEHVDRLAKQATLSGSEVNYNIPFSDSINITKNKLRAKWQQRWFNYGKATNTSLFRISPHIPTTLWHDNFNVSRRFVTTITRLRFGHASCPSHLHKIKVLTSNQCDRCHVVADLDHILFECVKYSNCLYSTLQNLYKYAPINLLYVLSTQNKEALHKIMSFLHKNNIKL